MFVLSDAYLLKLTGLTSIDTFADVPLDVAVCATFSAETRPRHS